MKQLLLPVITLILILCNYMRKNGKRFDIVTLLISAYLFMGGISLLIELAGLFPSNFPFAFEPMAYLSVCFFIVFWGFTGFNNQKFKAIKIENLFLLKAIESLLIIGGFLAIIFFLPFAQKALTGNIADNRDYVVFSGSSLGEWGIVNSVFSLLANLFLLAQVCAFLNLVPREGKRNVIKAYMLMASSLSYVVYILSYAGRDGVVYWIMSYLFCFLLFRNFVKKEDLKNLNWVIGLCSTVLLVLFFLISIARFSETIGGTGWQLIRYAGQQIQNFNDHYQIEAPITHGRLAFPEFIKSMDYIGINVGSDFSIKELQMYFIGEGIQPNMFTTFIGLLMIDIGKIGTLVYLVIVSFITRIILKKVSKTGIFCFSNLVLFILLYQIVYWGVFYFRQYSANYYIIFMILLFIFLKIPINSRATAFYIKSPEV